jgi:ribulose 1,5-bisphosphate synthetase/thiazole synthase
MTSSFLSQGNMDVVMVGGGPLLVMAAWVFFCT